MRLYLEIGRKSFQRMGAYRLATLTGVIVNSFFAYIQSTVFIAVFSTAITAQVGGLDLSRTLTYVWLVQAMISITQIWFDREISKTITTGDVVSDFYKPFDYQTYWFSRFVGNSFFGFIFRSVPTFLIGMWLFNVAVPKNFSTVPLFIVSLAFSIMVSFLTCYLANMISFWTISGTGIFTLAITVQMFFSGFVVPVAFMPDWLQTLVYLLPFQAIINVPSRIWLEQDQTWLAVLPQIGWAIGLWWFARWVTWSARQKVTIQGG
jgi:ABC-2 type transport system permease protein